MTGRHFENKHFTAEIKDEKPVLEVRDLSCEGDYEDVIVRPAQRRDSWDHWVARFRTYGACAFPVRPEKADGGKDFYEWKKKLSLLRLGEAMKTRLDMCRKTALRKDCSDQSIGRNIVISEPQGPFLEDWHDRPGETAERSGKVGRGA